MLQAPDDVVVLIPGFLGFEAIFNVHYFGRFVARRLETFLRAHGVQAEICVADTLPAARLRRRRDGLVTWLRRNVLEGRRTRPRIHLVGHSTGGVDAYALATGLLPGCDEDDELRRCIRTVVTIASPMRGTSIVAAPELRAVRGPLFPILAFRLLEPRAQLAILRDPMTLAIAPDLVIRPWHLARFVHELSTDNQLLDDLSPDAMGWMHPERRDELAIAHYVTIAARSWEAPAERSATREGALYASFVRLMQSGQRAVRTDARARAWPEIARRIDRDGVFASDEGRAAVRGVTDAASDGVVDSALQFVRAEDIRGVVVGDHLDVLGHYGYEGKRRTLRHPFVVRSERGFLHSGSALDDHTFDALWMSVAGVIAPRLELEQTERPGARVRRSIRAGLESLGLESWARRA